MYIIISSKGQWCGHQRLRPTRALFSFGPGSTSKRKRSCLRVPRYEYLGKYSFWSMLRHFFQQQTNTRWLCWEWLTGDRLVLYVNLKQNEAQSARAESTNKGVNLLSKYVTPVQQQRPESPTVTLSWHACKYKVHKLHLMYILCTCLTGVWPSPHLSRFRGKGAGFRFRLYRLYEPSASWPGEGFKPKAFLVLLCLLREIPVALPTWVRHKQQPQEHSYPFLSVCVVFSCAQVIV